MAFNQREFRVSKDILIKARSVRSGNGTSQQATLILRGLEKEKGTSHYTNRPWERYDYETALTNLLHKTTSLNEKERAELKHFIEQDQTDWSGMESVARIAALGDVFGSNQKEKNDWKARMLKAGLGSSGLQMPEDWDSLSENEKERRLNNVMAELKKH